VKVWCIWIHQRRLTMPECTATAGLPSSRTLPKNQMGLAPQWPKKTRKCSAAGPRNLCQHLKCESLSRPLCNINGTFGRPVHILGIAVFRKARPATKGITVAEGTTVADRPAQIRTSAFTHTARLGLHHAVQKTKSEIPVNIATSTSFRHFEGLP